MILHWRGLYCPFDPESVSFSLSDGLKNRHRKMIVNTPLIYWNFFEIAKS